MQSHVLQESVPSENLKPGFTFGKIRRFTDVSCETGWWTSCFEPNYIVIERGAPVSIPIEIKDGGSKDDFVVSPPLPRGLRIDAHTGTISGVCQSCVTANVYRVTCRNECAVLCSEDVRIWVREPIPTTIRCEPLTFLVGKHIQPFFVLGKFWDVDLKLQFSCLSLPAGLYLDESTGEIFGIPEKVMKRTLIEVYWKSKFDKDGATNISIEILALPSSIQYVQHHTVSTSAGNSQHLSAVNRDTSIILRRDRLISLKLEPVGGSEPISFCVKPDLPKGLKLCSKSGEISGYPQEVAHGTWKVCAENKAGTNFTIIKFASDAVAVRPDALIRPCSSKSIRPARPRLGSISNPRPKSQSSLYQDHKYGIHTELLKSARFVGEFAKWAPRPEAKSDWAVISAADFENFLERRKHPSSGIRIRQEQVVEPKPSGLILEKRKSRVSKQRISNPVVTLTPNSDGRLEEISHKHGAQPTYVKYHYRHEEGPPRFGQPGECLSVFSGHKDCVLAVCTLPQQDIFFSGSADNTALMWEASTGKTIAKFCAHTKGVKAICTSVNLEMMYTASLDWTARSWNIQSRKKLIHYKGHQAPLTSITQTHRHILITGSEDRTVIAWHQTSGEILRQFKAPEASSSITCVSLSEGAVFATYGLLNRRADSGAFVCGAFDLESGEFLYDFKGHTMAVNGCAIAGPHTLLTCSNDTTAKLFDIRTCREVRNLTGHASAVLSCSVLLSKNLAFTGSEDKAAMAWDLGSGQQVMTFGGDGQYDSHRDSVVSVSASETKLFTCSLDGTARSWCITGISEDG